MKMESPQENGTEKKESLNVLKPITPELLLEKHEVLENVYKKLAEKRVRFYNVEDGRGNVVEENVRQEYVDYRGLIDSGPEYEKTNLKTILFYVACNTGLFSLQYDDGNYSLAEDYIKLLYEDKEKARVYLDEQLSRRNAEQIKKCDMISDGLSLSTIIPEAPELITQPMINGTKSKIGSMDSDKASLLINSENEKQLEDFFKDKTLIDLGAGGGSAGIRIAEILGSKNYIGVEPFNTHKLLFFSINELYVCETTGMTMTGKKAQGINKFHIAKTDMRTFLQKLPDTMENTVFFISGVDDLILGNDNLASRKNQSGPSEFEAGQQYTRDIDAELNRLVTKGNILVVYESNFYLNKKNGFIRHKLEDVVGNPIYIYEKI